MSKAQDDDLVISLVESALEQPRDKRESYLREACSGDVELLAEATEYMRWEDRMQGFLLDPLFPRLLTEHQFEPGELLDGRFRIVREIAQGGMGIVFEAVDEKLRKRIALKAARAGFGKRLFPEVRHASEISHPNVCRIFELHTASTPHGEIDFITMEFLDGETLTARLKRGRLADSEARAIATQICQGLEEAHRNRVVHGDLKSNNVILTRAADGGCRAVITDFGLARGPLALIEEGATSAAGFGRAGFSEAGGTPEYMAPELWKGGKASAASDVYALGVILYELATGNRPFSEPFWRDGAPGTLPPTNSKWDRILARCLDPDPTRRFQDGGQVALALEPSRKWRWGLSIAASVALALSVGTITYQRATAPQESVRLALLPLEASPEISVAAARLSEDVSREVARLKGGKRVRLTFVPLAEVMRQHVDSPGKARTAFGATHIVEGRLTRKNGNFVIHALVIDTGTQANKTSWDFSYTPSELHYAPAAVAAIASAALHVSPLPVRSVNTAASRYYLSGLAYTRRNSTMGMALSSLQRAVDADTDSALTWAALAEAQWFKYFITRDKAWLDGAAESLRQAQRRDLDVATVHRVNGLLRANSGSYELAEAEYQRSIELDPANAQTYWRLGQVYQKTEQLDLALNALKKAVQLEPDYFKMYLQLGAYYFDRGDLTQAIIQLEKSVRLAPDEPEAHFGLGTAYSNRGRWDDAERELRAATVPGGPPSAFNNLANSLITRGKDREAIPVLVSALQQFEHGDRYLWWMNLGDAYRRTSSEEESQNAYQEAFKAANAELARNFRDGRVRSGLAYLAARLHDRPRAESELAQVQIALEDKDTVQTVAWTYEALGEHDKAIDVLATLPDEVLVEVRAPNLAELRNNPRFKELLMSRHIQ